MKTLVAGLGVLLCVCCTAPLLQAQTFPPLVPPQYPCAPQAPDACGPGFYCVNELGGIYGPNYCVYPPFPPFQGVGPGELGEGGGGGGPMGIAAFPTHKFAHGPRDYFMVDQ